MATMKEIALRLAAEGKAVFPCVPGKKHPLYKGGFHQATRDPKQIEEWWNEIPDANPAIYPDACEPRLLVIDVDGEMGKASLVDLELEGLIPPTFEVSTPNGLHFYFELPDDAPPVPSSVCKIAPGTDVRAYGGYVLAPGARTSEGSYEITGSSAPVPLQAVPALIERCGSVMERSPEAGTLAEGVEDWDLKANIDKATRWLQSEVKQGRVAIENQGGNNFTYATAEILRDFALSEDMALRVLSEHWNDHCNPPWHPDDLERIVNNAYTYFKRPAGTKIFTPGALFEAEAEDDPLPGKSLTKPEGLYDGPEYAERPEPQWLISGVLQEASYTVASGRSQAGKSFCEIARALSVATGKPWLGLEVIKTGPVLYIAAEGQGRIWQDVRAWCEEFDTDPDSLRGQFFIFDRGARLNTPPGQKSLNQIFQWISHVTGQLPTLVVFDTLRRNMQGGVSQEEPTSDVLHEIGKLNSRGIATILIAHHGRGHSETKGLTEWEDDADSVAIYSGTVRDGSTQILFSKVKSGKDGWSLGVKYQARGDTLVASEGTNIDNKPNVKDKRRKPHRWVTIREILEEQTTALTTNQLADILAVKLRQGAEASERDVTVNSLVGWLNGAARDNYPETHGLMLIRVSTGESGINQWKIGDEI